MVHPAGRRPWRQLVWVQCAVLWGSGSLAADQPPGMSAEALARVFAEIPQFGEAGRAQLSPDGEWVVYSVARHSVANNTIVEQRRLQRLQPAGGEPDAPVVLPVGMQAVRWHPSAQSLGFLASSADGQRVFSSYDVATSKTTQLPADFAASVARAVGDDYQWSPRGTYVAFTASLPPTADPAGLDPRRGVLLEQWKPQAGPTRALFVLDVESGKVRQLTPESVHVARRRGFAWSPDEKRLAVVLDHQYDSQNTDTDLFVVDVETRTLKQLVVRPGMDGAPVWSGDGQWIAFETHHGKPDYHGGWPAVIAASGGDVMRFSGAPRGSPQVWLGEEDRFLFSVSLDMTTRLMRANVRDGSVSAPLPRVATGSGSTPADDGSYAFSRDAHRMVFVRSTFTTPPQLLYANLDAQGEPSGQAQVLEALAPDFMLGQGVGVEKLVWRSADHRYSIHGLLATPALAAGDVPAGKPGPVLLYLHGGPTMVRQGFATEAWGGVPLYLVLRGYSVLIPNTRGRGGYEDELLSGIRTDKSNVRGPYGDAMAGIDELISRGIADSEQLGVLGFSYGGVLTAYTITQTDRFKAAVINEGAVDQLRFFYPPPADSYRILAQRDLIGITDHLDPDVRARMLADSPALNADRIHTPTLLLYGANNLAPEAERFLAALRRHEVPSAAFVYDEGHVLRRPAAIVDSLVRTAEWLDRWVRGIAYPHKGRAREYSFGQ